MWLGSDLLAQAARLAGGGCLGSPAPRAAATVMRRGPHRLEPRLPGQLVHRCQRGGDATGPNPTDRGRPGTKRHLITDRRGVPLAFLLTGANTPRQPALRGADRRRARHHWQAGSTTVPTRQAARGQGLRCSPVPPGVPPSGHQAPNCTARCGEQRDARAPSLGHRAQLRLDQPVPTPHHPLRATRRHPSRLHLPRMLAHLPAQAPRTVLKGAVSLEDEVVIEATGNTAAVERLMRPYVKRVVVANSQQYGQSPTHGSRRTRSMP